MAANFTVKLTALLEREAEPSAYSAAEEIAATAYEIVAEGLDGEGSALETLTAFIYEDENFSRAELAEAYATALGAAEIYKAALVALIAALSPNKATPDNLTDFSYALGDAASGLANLDAPTLSALK